MIMSIKEILQKSKYFFDENNDIFISAIIILVAFASFGLGRLSKIEQDKMPVRIEGLTASVKKSDKKQSIVPKEKFQDKNIPFSPGGVLIGSKNGSKYHFPWCSGAKRIKEENKIVFTNIEEAKKAGYAPASNCKGLR
jgi:hypothetical protein